MTYLCAELPLRGGYQSVCQDCSLTLKGLEVQEREGLLGVAEHASKLDRRSHLFRLQLVLNADPGLASLAEAAEMMPGVAELYAEFSDGYEQVYCRRLIYRSLADVHSNPAGVRLEPYSRSLPPRNVTQFVMHRA